MLIIVTVLLNIGAIAAWSFITGQNGFKEAAKMLRGEAAFIRQDTGDSEAPVEADPANEGIAPTSPRRTARPNPYDSRFGRHPSEFYE